MRFYRGVSMERMPVQNMTANITLLLKLVPKSVEIRQNMIAQSVIMALVENLVKPETGEAEATIFLEAYAEFFKHTEFMKEVSTNGSVFNAVKSVLAKPKF